MEDDIRDQSCVFGLARNLVVASLLGASAFVGYSFAATALGSGKELRQQSEGAHDSISSQPHSIDPKSIDPKSIDPKSGEGKCGDGSCGDDSSTASDSSAKQSADAKDKKDSKDGEGKCGAGSCGDNP